MQRRRRNYEHGILTREDTDGLELHWGDAKAVIALLNLMGERRGIGAVLVDGVKQAAAHIGRGSEQYAIHVGGQELPMHDPKLQPEYHTTYKLDPTPARHTQYEPNHRFGLIPYVPAGHPLRSTLAHLKLRLELGLRPHVLHLPWPVHRTRPEML